AALHDASGGYYGPGLQEGNGHPGDKFGWAVTPAFLINSPFGLTGDAIAGQAVYSKGAAGYAVATVASGAVFRSGFNAGIGFINEGTFVDGGNVELTTVWSFNAAYEHRWNPQWRTSLYGGMLGAQYDGAAKAALCHGGLTGISNISNCDPNWSMS